MSEAVRPVLVLNSGSSSLKYQLVVPDTADVLARGTIEKLGEGTGVVTHVVGAQQFTLERPIGDHPAALAVLQEQFGEHGPDLESAGVRAVGHRVVHGGRHSDPVLIDDDVLAAIDDLRALAPLHNPPAAAGIRAAKQRFGQVPHVAVFDTAFFATLPPEASTYAIPRDLADRHQIRRYGFHGTSHAYVSAQVAETLGRPVAELRQVVLHLGNGCSASAIRGGVAVDTSMGLTPLQGLVMGTRSGDVDPSLPGFLHAQADMSPADVDTLLNSRSGLKGLAGVNDFRELQRLRAAGDPEAELAFGVYVHRLKHYVGAYLAVLGGLDALTFTAGVGEHSPDVRAATVDGLAGLGIELDPDLNEAPGGGARVISSRASRTQILVVPTNEELAIARQTVGLLDANRNTSPSLGGATPH